MTENEIDICERLRLFRLRTGLNITRFCNLYKLPRTTYSTWEKKKKPPNKASIQLILCILKEPSTMERILNEICS